MCSIVTELEETNDISTIVVTKKQKNVSCTSGTTCVGIQGGDSTNQTQESQISKERRQVGLGHKWVNSLSF